MSGTTNTGGGYRGPLGLQTGGNEFNAISFLVNQIIAGKAFAAMVKVISVSGTTVAVQPLVDQVDGNGKQYPHGTIYNIPAFRLQGAYGAVILDPGVGEIGQAVICHNDISKVKATGAQAGPGSARRNNWSDGCYFGGFMNAAPTQFVQFDAGGITITSTGTVTINATSATVNAATSTFNGNIHASGTISASGGVSDGGGSLAALRSDYNIHKHTGVTTGGGTTGPTDSPA